MNGLRDDLQIHTGGVLLDETENIIRFERCIPDERDRENQKRKNGQQKIIGQLGGQARDIVLFGLPKEVPAKGIKSFELFLHGIGSIVRQHKFGACRAILILDGPWQFHDNVGPFGFGSSETDIAFMG